MEYKPLDSPNSSHRTTEEDVPFKLNFKTDTNTIQNKNNTIGMINIASD